MTTQIELVVDDLDVEAVSFPTFSAAAGGGATGLVTDIESA